MFDNKNIFIYTSLITPFDLRKHVYAVSVSRVVDVNTALIWAAIWPDQRICVKSKTVIIMVFVLELKALLFVCVIWDILVRDAR